MKLRKITRNESPHTPFLRRAMELWSEAQNCDFRFHNGYFLNIHTICHSNNHFILSVKYSYTLLLELVLLSSQIFALFTARVIVSLFARIFASPGTQVFAPSAAWMIVLLVTGYFSACRSNNRSACSSKICICCRLNIRIPVNAVRKISLWSGRWSLVIPVRRKKPP